MNFFMEIAPILLAVVALLLGAILVPIGIVYTFAKPFYDYRKKGLKTILTRFVMWWFKVIYQVWNVVKYSLFQIAYIVDILGNVLVGELIEDIVTAEENTWFGDGGITISAALGKLEYEGKLNKTGLWFSRLLSKFDKGHCIKAYHLYVGKNELKARLEAEAEAEK